MQIGDKVRFLNQPGEGIVTQVLRDGRIEVAIDGDFKIPFMPNQLVPIAREEQKVFGRVAPENAAQKAAKLGQATSTLKAELGVYLALMPRPDQQVELYFCNNTDFALPYTFGTERAGLYSGVIADVIQPRSTKAFGLYHKSDVNKWPLFVIQLLYHKHGQHELKKPFLRKLSIEPEVLAGALKKLGLLPSPAYIIPVDDVLLQKPKVDAVVASIQKQTDKALAQKSPAEKVVHAVPDVVDLHIEKLVSNPAQLNGDEILKFQLEHFEKTLSMAIAGRKEKVTYIHGVGSQILKKFLLLKLKDHKQVKNYRDAPASLYGQGATEVLLKD